MEKRSHGHRRSGSGEGAPFPAAALRFPRGARDLRKPAGTPGGALGARTPAVALRPGTQSRSPAPLRHPLGRWTPRGEYSKFLIARISHFQDRKWNSPGPGPQGGDRSVFLRRSRVPGVRASTRQQSSLVRPARRAPLPSRPPQPHRQPSTQLCGIRRPGLWALGRTVFSWLHTPASSAPCPGPVQAEGGE